MKQEFTNANDGGELLSVAAANIEMETSRLQIIRSLSTSLSDEVGGKGVFLKSASRL